MVEIGGNWFKDSRDVGDEQLVEMVEMNMVQLVE